MEIAVDFDGTCVTHDYPKVGLDIGAEIVLKKLVERGDRLILFTMRHGQELEHAKQWFADHEIQLYGVGYNPTQCDWTKSNKCYAQLYIDDVALGCPLIFGQHLRPYVDWEKVSKMLMLPENTALGIAEE